MDLANRSEAEAVGRLLGELLGDAGTVIVSRGDDEYAIGATVGGRRTHAVAETLLAALEKAAGRRVVLVCRQCGNHKPLDEFVRNADYGIGRKPVCLVCERERWRLDNQRRAERRRRPAA